MKTRTVLQLAAAVAVLAGMSGHRPVFAAADWNGSVSSDYFTPANWNENAVPTVVSGQVNLGNVASTNQLVYAGDNSLSQSPLLVFGGANSDGMTFTMSSGTFVNGGMNMGTSAATVTFTMNGGVIQTNQTGGGGNFQTSRAANANVNFNMSGGRIEVNGGSTGSEVVLGQGGANVSATTSMLMSGGTIQSNGRVVFGISPSSVTTNRPSRAQVTMTGGLMWATGSRDTTNDDRGTVQFSAGGIDFQGGTLRGTDISFRDGFNIGADNYQGQGAISGVNFRGGVLEVITNRTEGTIYVIPQGADPSTVVGTPAQRGQGRSLAAIDFRFFTSSTDSAVRVLLTTATNGKAQSNTFASLKGDFNLDGMVNYADYQFYSTQVGGTYCGDPLDVAGSLLVYYGADGNGDGFVSSLDYDVWSSQYGQRTTGGPYVAAQDVSINVTTGSQTQGDAGYSQLTFLNTRNVTKTGAGTLVLNGTSNTFTGTTSVQGGRVMLANASAMPSSTLEVAAGGTAQLSPYVTTRVEQLAVSGGLVDVASGMLTVNRASAAAVLAQLIAGRGDGTWNGTSGITSSVAAGSNGERNVGWLDNGDGSITTAFAVSGDTNLDWQVDVIDVSNFLAGNKYDSGTLASWIEGDFNYDGFVDILDAASFVSSNLFDAGAYNPPPGGTSITAVPEPSSAALAACVAGLVLAGRLRRRAA